MIAAVPAVFAVEVSSVDIILLVVVFFLLLASLFLSLAETALTRISPSKASALVEQGRAGATHLHRLVKHPEHFLNPVLLVVLVCQLVQATLTGVVADRLFGPWGVVISTFVNVAIVFVFAEAAPKTWAVQHPETAALLSARPVAALVAFPPIRLLSRLLIGVTNVILPGKGLKNGPYISEHELLALADVAVEEDVIEEEERELIESIIEFGDTIVREVMVPRPDMVAVPINFRVADVMEVVILNGFSRLPAYAESIDDIAGIVYAKDLMKADRDGHAELEVSTLLRDPHFVPETKKIAMLLREMQAEQYHMAIVVDEYGGTAGVVTLEDLIEELVGEIVDEYDREEAMVEPLAGGNVRVNARMPIDEVNELLKADLPEGDWDSIGGLMFHLLGHSPVEGETAIEDGFELRADRVVGRRISRVRLTRLHVAEEAEAEAEAVHLAATAGAERDGHGGDHHQDAHGGTRPDSMSGQDAR
jgi:CBS domain containing-hemolysin-like protein